RTLERQFDPGIRFAQETGLANRTVLEVLHASRMFGRATMAMLGNSVFATGNTEQLATLYRKFGTLQRCEVDNVAARVLWSLAKCAALVVACDVAGAARR